MEKNKDKELIVAIAKYNLDLYKTSIFYPQNSPKLPKIEYNLLISN